MAVRGSVSESVHWREGRTEKEVQKMMVAQFKWSKILQNGVQNQKDMEEIGKLSFKWIEE